MKLTLAEITQAVDGQLIVSSSSAEGSFLHADEAVQGSDAPVATKATSATDQVQLEATSITWDSREVVPGSLFVALPGERVDGHQFVSSALEKGAVAVLVSYRMADASPQIVVQDTSQAFTQLAAYWRSKLKGTVIGITGSTGKTTTKGLVRDVLRQKGSVIATKANQNNELGVPNTILAADGDTDFVVVEMGMRGLGQIADLCEVAQPDWGIITNVGESHCELLGSRENIARAKSELFEALPADGCAFVNVDDDHASYLIENGNLSSRGVQIVAVGENEALPPVSPTLHVWAKDAMLDQEGQPSFMLCLKDASNNSEEIACSLQLRGLHNVSNACMAAAVGLRAGLSLEECASALAVAEPEDGRQSFKQTATGNLLIDDAYNASPDSMKASLDTFAALEVNGKRIAILGDMGELGEHTREAHRSVGRMAAHAGIDTLICAGELARDIAQGAIDEGLPEESVHTMDNALQALDHIKDRLDSDDAVLVKASHFMGFEAIVEGLME